MSRKEEKDTARAPSHKSSIQSHRDKERQERAHHYPVEFNYDLDDDAEPLEIVSISPPALALVEHGSRVHPCPAQRCSSRDAGADGFVRKTEDTRGRLAHDIVEAIGRGAAAVHGDREGD